MFFRIVFYYYNTIANNMEILLMPEEQIVVSSEDKRIVLTNVRLLIAGKSYSYSLFLEEISSIEVFYYGDLYYLLVVLVVVFCGEQFLLTVDNNTAFLAIQIGSCITAIIFWWCFHRAKISINSKSGKEINVMVNQKAVKKIPDFLYQIELQKNERLTKLTTKH
jgi:hypothetical protein